MLLGSRNRIAIVMPLTDAVACSHQGSRAKREVHRRFVRWPFVIASSRQRRTQLQTPRQENWSGAAKICSSEYRQYLQPLCHRLIGVAAISCRGAIVRRSGLADAPCRRRQGSNRTTGLAEGARALPAKIERRCGQESLLFRHGCDASQRSKQWQRADFTLSANPTGRFMRFRRVTAADAI